MPDSSIPSQTTRTRTPTSASGGVTLPPVQPSTICAPYITQVEQINSTSAKVYLGYTNIDTRTNPEFSGNVVEIKTIIEYSIINTFPSALTGTTTYTVRPMGSTTTNWSSVITVNFPYNIDNNTIYFRCYNSYKIMKSSTGLPIEESTDYSNIYTHHFAITPGQEIPEPTIPETPGKKRENIDDQYEPVTPPESYTTYNHLLGWKVVVDENLYANVSFQFIRRAGSTIYWRNLETITVKSSAPLVINERNQIWFGINNSRRIFVRIANSVMPLTINNSENINGIAISSDEVPNEIIGIEEILNGVGSVYEVKIDEGFIIDKYYYRLPQPMIGGLENTTTNTMLYQSLNTITSKSLDLQLLTDCNFIDSGLNNFDLYQFNFFNRYLEYPEIIPENEQLPIGNIQLDFNQVTNDKVNDKSNHGNYGIMFGDMEINDINGKIIITNKQLPSVIEE